MKSIIILLLFTGNYFAQNLIYNNSFELKKECPYRLSGLKLVLGWKTPSKGTPDYFNQCSKDKSFLVPTNFVGTSKPYSGNAYVGFGYYFKEKHIEYIQTKLLENLNIDKKYCLEFYLKKASKYRFSFDELSILFSKEEVKMEHSDFYDNKIIAENNIITYKIPLQKNNEWTKITMCYKPKKEEQYLTIGFNNPININKLHMQARVVGSYYYIDDISLFEIKDSSECKCTQQEIVKKDSIKVKVDTVKSYDHYDDAKNKPMVLNNIVFANNKAELLPVSNIELSQLVNYLKQNNLYKIELSGYTDNVGKEEDNQKLSEARAKSVADYLIKEGIDSKRITYKGYGSKQPIKPNTTEENKAQNRRVEFKF